MIQSKTQLNDFLDAIKDETELVIDTEFRRVNTYYPVLCLLQIATKVKVDCIDILAFNNLNPLFDVLYDDNKLWILHAARQDIEALYLLSKRLPKHLFDTQIAAALLGHPTQISYQALTQTLQNIHLPKDYTRFNWTLRPLPSKAVEYALDDVRYLHQNYQQLQQQLQAQNKLNWIVEEADTLLDLGLYQLPIKQAWKRLKNLSKLPKPAQSAAIKIAQWREQQAQQKDKPRQWILADKDLFAYATGEKFFNNKDKHSFNHFLTQNPDLVSFQPIIKKNNPPTEAEKTQKKCLQKLIQQKANQYNLDPQIFASNSTLLKYIRGNNAVPFCKGWRFNLLKKELIQCKTV